ncbi:hypothetical protein GJ688_12670 [Heliobacillus mobilis]|uniref:Uncharacterized protein n=1 Tax=Heliobacterium mobile TaxID=28064 RepID=A0A6I3SM63_HELMO|nr:hypothetical protein [Heliobacterium mobile]MTV49825.1 hypothetical protein [Heliobacterium mobile]
MIKPTTIEIVLAIKALGLAIAIITWAIGCWFFLQIRLNREQSENTLSKMPVGNGKEVMFTNPETAGEVFELIFRFIQFKLNPKEVSVPRNRRRSAWIMGSALAIATISLLYAFYIFDRLIRFLMSAI